MWRDLVVVCRIDPGSPWVTRDLGEGRGERAPEEPVRIQASHRIRHAATWETSLARRSCSNVERCERCVSLDRPGPALPPRTPRGAGRHGLSERADAALQRVGDQLRAALHAESLHRLVLVVLDRAPREPQARGDLLDPRELGELLNEPVDTEALYSEAITAWERSPEANDVDRSICFYIDLYLQDDILTKVDRASMAHALEVRVPLLDHELVEWMSSLPASVKLKNGEGKYIFKKALEPYLSDNILYRNKMGFSVPLADWFRGPLRQHVRNAILGPVLAETGIFNRTYLEELVEHHQSGKRDYSAPLWTLLMFESFMRNIVNGENRFVYERKKVA